MKIRFILSVFVVIAAAFLVIAAPVSAQVSVGSDDAETVVPASESSDISADVTVGGDDAEAIAPVTVAADLTGSVTVGGDDAEAVAPATPSADLTGSVAIGGDDEVVTPTAPTQTNTNTNSSSGGGSSSSRRSLGAKSSNISIATTSCPVITSQLLKIGGSNDSADVSRLQAFLKNVEKLDVEINGTFDAKTEAAVKSFQIKYKDIVLAPWKATKASGVVYITTIKKINEIGCGAKLTLSPAELAIMEAYGKKTVTTPESTDVVGTVEGTTDAEGTVIVDAVSSSTEAEANVAGAADAPVLKRFWNFVVDLFR